MQTVVCFHESCRRVHGRRTVQLSKFQETMKVHLFERSISSQDLHVHSIGSWKPLTAVEFVVKHSNLMVGFLEKRSLHRVLPLMNLDNQDKVLSHVELVLLKKGHSSLGIEGNWKLLESNGLLWKVWTLEIQRLSDLSKFLKLLAGCNDGIKFLSETRPPLPPHLCMVFWFSAEI